MTILPKAIYSFNAIYIKIPKALFTEQLQKILKFVWKHKDPKQPKQSLERRTKLEVSYFLTLDYTTKLQ